MSKKAHNTQPVPSGTGRRPGRPTLPPGDKRLKRVEVFFSESELAEIAVSATATALACPAFIRAAALGLRPRARVPVADVRLSGDLKRLGNVLDQLARAANSGRVVGVSAADLTGLSDRLDSLSATLLTGARNDYGATES